MVQFIGRYFEHRSWIVRFVYEVLTRGMAKSVLFRRCWFLLTDDEVLGGLLTVQRKIT